MLKILTNPNEKLRKVSEPIKPEHIKTTKIRRLCSEMAETMLKKDGIGLAAPQIGENIRIIVVNTKDGVLTMINPRLIKKSVLKEWGEEGCLSVPNIFGDVKRHKKLTCCYLDLAGKNQKLPAEGLLARVLQHEVDHLDGVLFIDKGKNLRREEKS